VTASFHRSGIDVARLNVLRDVEQAAEGAARPSPSSGSPWARFQGQPWFRTVSSGHICVRWFQWVIPSQWRRGSPARRGLGARIGSPRRPSGPRVRALLVVMGSRRWVGRVPSQQPGCARAGAPATCISGSVGRGSDVLRWLGQREGESDGHRWQWCPCRRAAAAEAAHCTAAAESASIRVSNRWDLVSSDFVASAAPGTESLSAAGVGLAAGKRRAGCRVRPTIRTKVRSELGATWPMPTGMLLSVVLAQENVVPVERKLFAAALTVLVARAAGVLNDLRRRPPARGGPSSGSRCSSGSALRRPESSTPHSRCGSSCMKQTVHRSDPGAE
jgi:hypothetical protein